MLIPLMQCGMESGATTFPATQRPDTAAPHTPLPNEAATESRGEAVEGESTDAPASEAMGEAGSEEETAVGNGGPAAESARAIVGAPTCEGRDIVRDYLAQVRRGAPHDARRYHEACEVAYARKPSGLTQATDALELARLSNAQCKVMLSVMNVTGCKNACLAAKKYILACKMVQRQVALQALFDITTRLDLVQAHEQRADGGTAEEEVARIKNLPKTSASAEPVRPGMLISELVSWARGDVPVFVDDDIVIGAPSLEVAPNVLTLGVPSGSSGASPRAPDAPRVGRPRKADSDDGRLGRRIKCESEDGRIVRRRRLSSGEALMMTESELQIIEADAVSASAKAVQESLKAIKDAEAMISECEADDESGRAFYRSIITQLRQKLVTVVGSPKP